MNLLVASTTAAPPERNEKTAPNDDQVRGRFLWKDICMSVSILAQPQDSENPSTVYRDAEVEARSLSTDALLAALEVFALDAEDPHPTWPGETGRWFAAERLRAFETELERRVRIIRLPDSQAAKYAKDYEQWVELARTVREVVSAPDVLLLVGCPPTRTGSSRHGETEHHGPCPSCGDGTDRLVSWDGPRSRCWCRRCGWRGDAIAVAQAFLPGCSHFRDAVRYLASLHALSGAQS